MFYMLDYFMNNLFLMWFIGEIESLDKRIMIVNYTEAGWKIITQRSHGLLAAQLCAQWKIKNRPIRWIETLIAVAEHDDVYNEFENKDLLNDAGGPKNFKQAHFREDYCERLLKMAESKSAFIALLQSSHLQFVHASEPEAKTYCAKLKKRENKWLQICDVKRPEVEFAYELVQFCDAFSLLLCQDLVQPEHRKIEISKGPGGIAYELYAVEADQLRVSPWPFETSEFSVIYESRDITELVYRDASAFQKALTEAAVCQHEILISNKKI